MGRIKTTLIKRVTNKLIAKHPTEFKENFEENKKIVSELTDISSKKTRNVIAGYVTRLTKNRDEIEKDVD